MDSLKLDLTELAAKLLRHTKGDKAKAERLMAAYEEGRRQYREGTIPQRPNWLDAAQCQYCHGAGRVYSFTETRTIFCPQCQPGTEVEWAYRATGMPWEQRGQTFESFKVEEAEGMREAVAWAYEVAKTGVPPWLVLWGETKGVGKTHLAIAAGQVLKDRGLKVRFWYVPELLDKLRAVFAPESKTNLEEAMHEFAQAPDWLILDDLGVQKSTPWATERLEMVIDKRHRDKRGLIVTMNCPPGMLSETLPRAYSRLRDAEMCQIVDCVGEDYRPRLRRSE